MTLIARVHARQILDSRGRPTVEVDIETGDGAVGRAAVPSGASTGTFEASELRDGTDEYGGLAVRTAVGHVNDEIAQAVVDRDVREQGALDDLLVDLDGTAHLGRLGANAILGVSLAACRAAARSMQMPLYRWVATLAGTTPSLPMPMVNILSGGLHAGRGMDVQDFLAVPASATSMEDATALVSRVRSAATELAADVGLPILLADEGGLSPGLRTGRAALELMVEAVERAGLTPGEDIVVAIDAAAHALWDADRGDYHLAREGRHVDTAEMIELVQGGAEHFPVASVEDALDEEDWDGWQRLTQRLGDRLNLIGDDLFTTNLDRLEQGIDLGVANGALVKVNQNGTLSGTFDSSELWRVDLDSGAICVKRALEKLNVEADWRAPVSRNAVEWDWLTFAADVAPGHVPEPLAHDRDLGLFAMRYLPARDHPVWKARLLAGAVHREVAAAVGDLIGRLHSASAGEPKLARRFATDANFASLRIEPYFVATARRNPDVAAELQRIIERTTNTRLAVVHGGVSPNSPPASAGAERYRHDSRDRGRPRPMRLPPPCEYLRKSQVNRRSRLPADSPRNSGMDRHFPLPVVPQWYGALTLRSPVRIDVEADELHGAVP